MIYTNNGAVEKYCKRCGTRMEIENYFEALSRKYCLCCAADVRREDAAIAMQEKRARARERRKLIAKENVLLADENAMLRERVRMLEEQVKRLHADEATE